MKTKYHSSSNLINKEFSLFSNDIKLKNRNYDSITTILNNIKNITHEYKEFDNQKTNYNNYRPIIYLYPNYHNNKNGKNKSYSHNHFHTINNYKITKPKFFVNKNIILNIKKNSYKKANTIDFNSDINFFRNNFSTYKNKKKHKKPISYLRKENQRINKNDKNSIDKILYYNYNNNLNLNNKIYNNYINISDNYFRKNIPIIKCNLQKNYNSINVTTIKHKFYKSNNLSNKEKEFLKEILKIYKENNNQNKENEKCNYKKIIFWLRGLINGKEIKNEERNIYEEFCKQIMKENNINDFSSFQNFAMNNIKEEKNANYFINDMKNILFKEIN